MMETMTTFSISILQGVAAFLGSEPIIYLFGLVCFVFIIKAVKIILQ